MKIFDVLYKGRKIYTDLTYEECAEILQDFSEKFFQGEDVDPNEIELEEKLNG